MKQNPIEDLIATTPELKEGGQGSIDKDLRELAQNISIINGRHKRNLAPKEALIGNFQGRLVNLKDKLQNLSPAIRMKCYKTISEEVNKGPEEAQNILKENFQQEFQTIKLEEARETIQTYFIDKHKEFKANGKSFDEKAIIDSQTFIINALKPAELNIEQMTAMTNGIRNFAMTTANSMGDLSWAKNS